MTTLSTWEAALWNVDWSSREGLKIFKAILLLKNPRGPEQERVSSALWLCCWRIAGDSLCISESGPVKDSFPSPSRLCQKHRSSYQPRQVHLPFTLVPVYPITPSSPTSFLCAGATCPPSCRHRATSTHCLCFAWPISLGNRTLHRGCLPPALPSPHAELGLVGTSLFTPPKGGCKS